MSLIGSIGTFNEAEEDFETYSTRVDLFFVANAIEDDSTASQS